MKVAIDTLPLTSSHQGRGVGTYTRELVKALTAVTDDIEIIATPNPYNVKADIIHYPYFDFFFHTLPMVHTQKFIVTIHDVIPLKYPKYFPRGVKGSVKLFLQQLALSTTAQVITDSSASKKDIENIFHFPDNKVTSIYLAASSSLKPASEKQKAAAKKQYSLPSEFLLYVGDINYNKNLPFLLKAMESINSKLVIITRAKLNALIPEAIAIKRAINKHNKEKVIFLQVESIKDLAALYSLATWYIQPSLDEGFGLPVLEAMQCGTPVISSTGGSLPEVGGDACLYFEPTKVAECVTVITKALAMKPAERAEALKKSQKQLARFSWEKTAKETLKVYRSVI